jgi:DNA-binding beta-propeller fold protein YncE
MRAHRYWKHASLVMVLSGFTFPAGAGHLVVSANDGKWPSIDGDYYAADPPVPDTLVILDATVFPPKVVGQVEVHHSVIAPPMAVAISPNETIALVSAPNRLNPDAPIVHGSRATNSWFIREPFIQVIDLEASPPRLIDRVALSTQAYGVSINKAGTLALAGHIEGTVSVLAIEGKKVTLVETLKIGEPKSRLSHVAFTPDGKWALATRRGEDKVSVLKVDGTKVTYTGRDITVGVQPYGMDIFPDGKLAAIADHGDEDGDADEITLVDLTREPFRAIEHVTVGQTPEGVAISPDSKWMAVSNIDGTNLPKKTSPFWTEHGSLMLFSIKNGHATKVAEAPVGKNNQGVTFTPDGKYILIQNYAGNELAAFRMTGTGMEDTGVRIKMPGSPASIRIAPQ